MVRIHTDTITCMIFLTGTITRVGNIAGSMADYLGIHISNLKRIIIMTKLLLGMSAAFVCATVVAFPILVSVFYFLAKFRDFLWSKYYTGGGSVEPPEDSVPTSIGTSTQRNGIYTVSIKLQDQ